MAGLLGQLLSPDAAKSLEDLGAVEHELPALQGVPREAFTVVAARGGDDIWIEIRRQRRVTPAAAPTPVAESPAAAGAGQSEPVDEPSEPERTRREPSPPLPAHSSHSSSPVATAPLLGPNRCGMPRSATPIVIARRPRRVAFGGGGRSAASSCMSTK